MCGALSFTTWEERSNRSMWLFARGTSFSRISKKHEDLMAIRTPSVFFWEINVWRIRPLEDMKITVRSCKRIAVPTCIWRALCSRNYNIREVHFGVSCQLRARSFDWNLETVAINAIITAFDFLIWYVSSLWCRFI